MKKKSKNKKEKKCKIEIEDEDEEESESESNKTDSEEENNIKKEKKYNQPIKSEIINNIKNEELNESEKDENNVLNYIEDNCHDLINEKYDFKKMILTQNIIEGNWNLNNQTKFLIEQNKNIYDKIKNYVEKFNINNKKEEIIITILVLYCLKNNSDIEQLEYTIIMNKGLLFLESFGIKEILYKNIELILN